MELDLKTSQLHMLNQVLKERYGQDCTGQLDTDLRSGKDVYRKVASTMFQVDIVSDEQRDIAKEWTFQQLFSGFNRPNKKSDPLKRKAHNAIKSLYPEMIRAVNRLKDDEVKGFEKTLTRIERVKLNNPFQRAKVERKNNHRKVSYVTTCKETDIMKGLWQNLIDGEIPFITVHDAILIDPKYKKKALQLFRQVLRNGLGYTPKIKVVDLSPPADDIDELSEPEAA